MGKKLQLIIAGLALGTCAFSQDSIYTKSLQEVVVTANKLPQKQLTTGKTISVITKDQIEKYQGRSIGQLLNEQTGITINGALNNAGTAQSLFMRGAASGRTLILLDGIPVYDPSQINNEFDLNLISLSNVERVEICRGGQSTIYGSDAIAGVINIITVKQDDRKPFALQMTASAGSYGSYKAGIEASGNTGKLSYGLKYAKSGSDGFSSATDSAENKNFDSDGFRSDILNGTVKYRINPSLTVKGFAQYSFNKTDLDAAAFSDETDYFFRGKTLIAGGGISYNKNKTSFALNYQYSRNNRSYFNDSLDVPASTRFMTDDYHSGSHYLEEYARVDIGGGFSVLQGADYRSGNMKSLYYSESEFGPYKSEFRDTSHSQGSLFASVFYSGLNDKLNAEAGGRINVHSRYGSNTTFSFNPSFSFNEHYRITAGISSAFKAPTLYQLYSLYGNRLLKPEKGITYELGLEQHYAKMFSRVVFFKRKIDQGLDFDYTNFIYFNISRQTVKGIEFETSIQPIKSLSVSLNYTYLDPHEQSQSRVTYTDTVYHYLLKRPRHNGNITATYTFSPQFNISISGKYVSRRFDTGGYKKDDVILDDYFLLSAYAGFTFHKRFVLFADVQNITDRKFFDISGYNSIPFFLNAGMQFTL